MKNLFSMPGFLWLLLTLIVIVVIGRGLILVLRKSDPAMQRRILVRISVVTVLWVIVISFLSIIGFFSQFNSLPPRLPLVIILPLPAVFMFAFSKTGTMLLRTIPQHRLVFMQSFRIFVELLLWLGFLRNMLPVQMTFEGGNLDIITGILSVPVGFAILRQKNYSTKLTVLFNIIGLVLLLNILVIAMLSMPTPLRHFMNEPANTLVTIFPFILLPGVLVPVAYSLHILSLRKLFIERKEKQISLIPSHR